MAMRGRSADVLIKARLMKETFAKVFTDRARPRVASAFACISELESDWNSSSYRCPIPGLRRRAHSDHVRVLLYENTPFNLTATVTLHSTDG